jgi:hypothetical protein
MPTSTDLVTDLPADFAVFGQAVDTSMAELKGGTTGQVLSKTSNTDMDFTWVTSDDANAIQNTQLTAKGALISAFSAGTPATLTVGTNGQFLTADSTAATGLAWTTPAASGGMTLLSTTAMTGSTLTVSSISQSYKHLLVIAKDIYISTNDAGGDIRFNGDSGTKYTYSNIRMNNATTSNEAALGTELSNAMFSNPSTNTATKLLSVVLNIYRYTETSTIVGDLQSIATQDSSVAMSSRMPFSYSASAGITSISFLTNAGTFSGGNVYIYGVN